MHDKRAKFADLLLGAIVFFEQLGCGAHKVYLKLQVLANRFWASPSPLAALVIVSVPICSMSYDYMTSAYPLKHATLDSLIFVVSFVTAFAGAFLFFRAVWRSRSAVAVHAMPDNS